MFENFIESNCKAYKINRTNFLKLIRNKVLKEVYKNLSWVYIFPKKWEQQIQKDQS